MSLLAGVGEDAAVIRTARSTSWVVSCDAFLEKVHFLAPAHPPDAVGYKALARAASDLAAMGARPAFYLLSLSLPASRTGRWLEQFLKGMARASRKMGFRLAGGDTSQHSSIAVVITVIGEAPKGQMITRGGAQPGDQIYVSGQLGCAQLGLELVLRGWNRRGEWKRLLGRHLYPDPRLELGRWLAQRRLATSLIDTSDGLSKDLAHICEASRVGARIRAAQLPAVKVPRSLENKGLDALGLALHGGEDYELLFTVSRRLAKKIPKSFRGVKLTHIGEITRERSLVLMDADGTTAQLASQGWDHFRRSQIFIVR